MRIMIEAITPRGTFKSKWRNVPPEEAENIDLHLMNPSIIAFLSLDTDDGRISIPSELLKQSVVIWRCIDE